MFFFRVLKPLSVALIFSTAAFVAMPSHASSVAERCDWRGCSYIHCNYTGDRCYRVDDHHHYRDAGHRKYSSYGYGYGHRHSQDCHGKHGDDWRKHAYRRYDRYDGYKYDRYDDDPYAYDGRYRDESYRYDRRYRTYGWGD